MSQKPIARVSILEQLLGQVNAPRRRTFESRKARQESRRRRILIGTLVGSDSPGAILGREPWCLLSDARCTEHATLNIHGTLDARGTFFSDAQQNNMIC